MYSIGFKENGGSYIWSQWLFKQLKDSPRAHLLKCQVVFIQPFWVVFVILRWGLLHNSYYPHEPLLADTFGGVPTVATGPLWQLGASVSEPYKTCQVREAINNSYIYVLTHY